MQSCIEDCNSSICGSYASKNNPITGQSGMVSCPTAYGPEVSTHNTVTRSTCALTDLSAPSQWCIVSKYCAGNTITATYCVRNAHSYTVLSHHAAPVTWTATTSVRLIAYPHHACLFLQCANCCRSSATVWTFASTAVAVAAAQPQHLHQHQHLLQEVHSKEPFRLSLLKFCAIDMYHETHAAA
jgi:hypothetical protein